MSKLAILIPSAASDRLRWFSFRPYADQGTPEGRAFERHRRVALTAVAAVISKVFAVLTAFISVPLTLHYLGVERFGMWMIISSLIAMLAFADFGIANGVLSAVAKAHGRDDRQAIRAVVSSGFFILLGIALTIIVVFFAVYSHVAWHKLFNVRTELSRAEAGPAVAVFIVCFAAAIPLSIVQRLQMGQQQGFVANLWQCAGSVVGLGAVLLVIHFEGSLPWLVLALAGGPQIAALLNSIHCYFFAQSDLRPRWASLSAQTARQVAGTGGLFFVLQLAGAVAFTSDSLFIAQLLGASSVPLYSVPDRLFALIPMVVSMSLSPLWPAYSEAIARNDAVWVRKTFVRSAAIAVTFSAGLSAVFILVGPTIINLWIGKSVNVPLAVMLAFGCWRVLESFGYSLAMLLNGKHVVRLQVVCAVPTAVVAVALKILLVPLLGVPGVLLASAVAWVVCTAIPICLRLPSMLLSRSLPVAAVS